MNIKLELVKKFLCNYITTFLDDIDFDVDAVADTTAILALSEIQKAIQNPNLSDFEVIEEIFATFRKYKLDFGSRHDFG
ncbi:MAG: hypothetical protein J6L59_03020 [Clostridia bacterium]|nr:hypothetical protein [Clostridia bacterium]